MNVTAVEEWCVSIIGELDLPEKIGRVIARIASFLIKSLFYVYTWLLKLKL